MKKQENKWLINLKASSKSPTGLEFPATDYLMDFWK
jgi:hypothetical protein